MSDTQLVDATISLLPVIVPVSLIVCAFAVFGVAVAYCWLTGGRS